MKVAIVHDFLIKLGGAERVVKSLSEIFPNAPIFTLIYDAEKTGKVFPKERVKTSFLQEYPKFIRKRHRLLTSKMPRAIEEIDLSGYDLIISSSGAFSHGAITNSNSLHVCYSHSPMRYAWDYANEYKKENGIKGLKSLYYSRLIKYLREWDQAAADRPDHYIANSENVRRRINKYYHLESDVIYPPVDTAKFRAKQTHENYFLIVSTLTPYKKIDLAISLFNKTGRKLVIIGDGPQRKYLENIAGENIDFLGFKDDETVKEYLQNCRALIFPGEEDFGISMIEAMACGKPVLAFAKGGAVETVISGKTGEFFFELNTEAMEDGLGRLLYNEKFYKASTIRRHATNFSKEVFEQRFKAKIRSLQKNFQKK